MTTHLANVMQATQGMQRKNTAMYIHHLILIDEWTVEVFRTIVKSIMNLQISKSCSVCTNLFHLIL